VDNRAAANAADAVTVSGSSLVGLAPADIRYSGSSTDDLTIFGGTSNTTYALIGSLGGSSLELSTGSGLDTVIVGNNGVIDDASFPGQVILDGNSVNSRLRFDNHVGPAKTLTATPTGLGGLTASDIPFSGFRDVEIDLGDANDQVTVQGATAGGASYMLNGGPGLNTLTFDAGRLPVGVVQGGLTAGDTLSVGFTNFQATNVNNAASVNTFYGPRTADRDSALSGLTAQERFVQALYLGALGRVGSRPELDGWASNLTAPGGAQALVASGIERSPEARGHLVRTWYQTYLGRTPQNDEELRWVTSLLQGESEENVLGSILSSPEFYNRAQSLVIRGTGDERYVQALYQVLLNRPGSALEVAGWVNALPMLGLGGVASGILSAREFRSDLIEAIYNALMHRPSDAPGLSGWLSSGLDATALRVAFEAGPEFFQVG
jgi:hypothetical protein